MRKIAPIFYFVVGLQLAAPAQMALHPANGGTGKLLVKPFENKVFIKEQGQFNEKMAEGNTSAILFGVENAENWVSGVYYYSMEIDGTRTENKKMVLIHNK